MWTIEKTARGWEVRHNGRLIGTYRDEAAARDYYGAMRGRDWN